METALTLFCSFENKLFTWLKGTDLFRSQIKSVCQAYYLACYVQKQSETNLIKELVYYQKKSPCAIDLDSIIIKPYPIICAISGMHLPVLFMKTQLSWKVT